MNDPDKGNLLYWGIIKVKSHSLFVECFIQIGPLNWIFCIKELASDFMNYGFILGFVPQPHEALLIIGRFYFFSANTGIFGCLTFNSYPY